MSGKGKGEVVNVNFVQRSAQATFVVILDEMEQAARRAGLYITARAINQAKNASGWEVAGDLEAAAAAARGDRAKETRGK